MKNISLATRYRPQIFADVAGQQLVTSVLSRAAAEDRLAPAYLLSGTRGVGKTTIARILAKALNCTHAPTAEPCNQCDQCRKITQGNHVDVTEIDGASNNSVEDARALRENIGYAPMEGRYKVFIIDEAHMLSRSAFNALLKTLEEPPPRVVFIFATTEAHKFPITIVSRCQHFIFKRVPEAGLMAHLDKVLRAENIPFDESAVRLIARRAAGSVRDAMSLLGQTLALGGDELSADATRSVLGLAGQDLFVRLLEALIAQDCLSTSQLLRDMLDQGVDIGFFLRELTSLWRTLFLIRQAGEAILPVLDLPEDEAKQWCALAPRLSLTHIHAAWQMVLDAQRRVIHSPEPAAALELLLLNIAMLPRLLPLEHMPGTAPAAPSPANAGNASGGAKADRGSEGATEAHGTIARSETAPQHTASVNSAHRDIAPASTTEAQSEHPSPQVAFAQSDTLSPLDESPFAASDTDSDSAVVPHLPAANSNAPKPQATDKAAFEQHSGAPAEINPTWEGFFAYCCEHGNGQCPQHVLRQTRGVFTEKGLNISTGALTLYQQIERMQSTWEKLAREYCGRYICVTIAPPSQLPKTEAELKAEFAQREELKPLIEIFDARISRCPPLTNTDSHSIQQRST